MTDGEKTTEQLLEELNDMLKEKGPVTLADILKSLHSVDRSCDATARFSESTVETFRDLRKDLEKFSWLLMITVALPLWLLVFHFL